jgi:hypothetical protein
MKVREVLSFQEYWEDSRFCAKRPDGSDGASILSRCGDNCYEPLSGGGFGQVWRSGHWDRERDQEDVGAREKDVGGEHVLVARRFAYFGMESPKLPPELKSVPYPGRGHRVKLTSSQKAVVLEYVKGLPRGIHGRPRLWKEADSSWKQGRLACD